jgi:hypothetical protein
MTRKLGFRTTCLLSSVGALALTLAGLRISLAEGSPHLAGKWNFNQDQSDDASKKIQDAEASAKLQRTGYPGGGGSQGGGYPTGGTYPNGTDYPGGGYPGGGGIGFPGGRGGMGGGGRGRGGQRGPMAQNAGLSSEDMEQLAANPKALTVEQEEKQVTITDDNGQIRNLYPDGKKHKEKDSSGQSTTIKTRWEGNRLVAESKLGHSGKLTESYELSPDAKQLYVVQQLDNSQLSQPLVIRRVYDSAGGTSK